MNVSEMLRKAIVVHRKGELDAAILLYRAIIEHAPDHATATSLLGAALHQSGDSKQAEIYLRTATQLQPKEAMFHNNLGAMLLDTGHHADARGEFQIAIRLNPSLVDAYVNLARILKTTGDLATAKEQLSRAEAVGGGRVDIELVRSEIYEHEGNLAAAIAALRRVVNAGHPVPLIVHNLVRLLTSTGNYNEAVALLQGVITHSPTGTEYLPALATAHEKAGDYKNAEKYFSQHWQHSPSEFLRKFRRDLVTPQIFDSVDQLQAYRLRLERAVADLQAQKLRFHPDVLGASDCFPPHLLAQLGECNRDFKQQFAACFRDSFSHDSDVVSQRPENPHLGIVITAGDEVMFSRTYGPLVRALLKCIEISIFCPPTVIATLRSVIPGARFQVLPGRLSQAAEVIAETPLSTLFFSRVGNCSFNYFLAHYRLAPFQFTSIGVQDTTGIPTVDAYISSVELESATSISDYSEQLYRPRELPFAPELVMPQSRVSRRDLGLPVSQPLFLCNQQLTKYHPQFDVILAQILEQSPEAMILVTTGPYSFAAEQLRTRWTRSLGKNHERIQFLPKLSYPAFLDVTRLADVVLDTSPCGGCWTVYDTLAVDTPLVTLKGLRNQGRYAWACLEKMGLQELGTESVEEFIQKSLRVGLDRDYRTSLSTQVKERKHVLFDVHQIATRWLDIVGR